MRKLIKYLTPKKGMLMPLRSVILSGAFIVGFVAVTFGALLPRLPNFVWGVGLLIVVLCCADYLVEGGGL